ncbi:hypothetical protein PENTCL1PPCAC_19373, partial [Pristionchus entomophagus]
MFISIDSCRIRLHLISDSTLKCKKCMSRTPISDTDIAPIVQPDQPVRIHSRRHNCQFVGASSSSKNHSYPVRQVDSHAHRSEFLHPSFHSVIHQESPPPSIDR